jgi:hypothetical protein
MASVQAYGRSPSTLIGFLLGDQLPHCMRWVCGKHFLSAMPCRWVRLHTSQHFIIDVTSPMLEATRK